MLYGNLNEVISLEDKVSGNDINGTEFIIVKMYANIVTNTSYNFHYDILNQELYNQNKAYCITKIKEFKTYAEQKALEYGVEII